MGLPNSRLDAFGGKYLSRSAVVTGAFAVGLLLTGLIVALWFEGGSFATIAALGGLTLLFAVVFVGIGLAISTLFSTESRASGAMIGVFFAFRFGWPALQYAGLRLTETDLSLEEYPDWYFFLGRLNPMNAYVKLADCLASPDTTLALITHPDGVGPVATTPGFAFAVLLAWAVVVPTLGYLRFRDVDLL